VDEGARGTERSSVLFQVVLGMDGDNTRVPGKCFCDGVVACSLLVIFRK